MCSLREGDYWCSYAETLDNEQDAPVDGGAELPLDVARHLRDAALLRFAPHFALLCIIEGRHLPPAVLFNTKIGKILRGTIMA